jgi:predicted DNA-binding transcriptional regulator AlpA
MTQDMPDPIYSEKIVAKWINTSCPTLQRQRSDGSGPPFVQLSERRIGYRKSAVEQWLVTRTINRVGGLVSSKQVSERATQSSTTSALSKSDGTNSSGFGQKSERGWNGR